MVAVILKQQALATTGTLDGGDGGDGCTRDEQRMLG